jgi:hypothetical protein
MPRADVQCKNPRGLPKARMRPAQTCRESRWASHSLSPLCEFADYVALSIAAAIDQGALFDPGHHGAQLGADLLDRVLGELGARGLE